MKFKVTKILDQGTNNKIVNRIYLQFSEMVSSGFFLREDEKQKEFRNLLFKLMKELLKVEKVVDDFIKIEGDSIKRLNSLEGIKYQKNGFSYDDPTIQLKEKFEDFLIKAVVSIRKFTKVSSFILNEDFESHKKLSSFLKDNLKSDSSFYKWLENSSAFVKEIYDLRGLAEHEELKIDKFDVVIEGNKIKINVPKITDTEFTLREYMQSGLKFLFDYFEYMIAQFLSIIYGGIGKIVKLDEDEMSKNRNFKYVVDFNAK